MVLPKVIACACATGRYRVRMRNQKWRDRKYVLRMRNQFPRFFLTIVVVSLRMIDRATGGDRRGSLGCARAQPEVGNPQFPVAHTRTQWEPIRGSRDLRSPLVSLSVMRNGITVLLL